MGNTNKEKEETVTPFGSIGYITYKRTYSRRLNEDDTNPNSPTEEFPQTIDRVLKACQDQLKIDFTDEQLKEARDYLLGLKCSVAGRFMWQLGTKTVDRLGLMSLQNCAAVAVNEPIRPFLWAFDALMLGSGVGYNIQKEYVHEIPRPKHEVSIVRKDTKDADFIVPDSREGWIELLHKTLDAHFNTGKSFTYSTVCVRGANVAIKSFGGTSSGPEALCSGIAEINKLLNTRAGKKLRPIDALDIMNIIGAIVVSGNVRRSAQIALGDQDDLQYLNAKRWDKGNIPNHRAMSNNSVVCNDIAYLPEQFWQGYMGNGEPYGLINLKLARNVGRSGDTGHPDKDVVCFNPCQPEFATVLTPTGIKQFKDISVGSEIWSREGWTTITNKQSSGVKPVYSYYTTGGVFIGTSNHQVETFNGKEEIENAEEVLTIAGESPVCVSIPEVVMDGLFFGDGYHKKMKGRNYTYPVLLVGGNDKDYFHSQVQHLLVSKFGNKGKCQEYRVVTTITEKEKQKTYNLSIPDRYFYGNTSEQVSFLRGLYSADGSVVVQHGNSCRVTYKTASKILVRQVQQMLSSIGIRSYITINKETEVQFANGKYTCKQSYDLNITKDVKMFLSKIGFVQHYKNDKASEALKKYIPNNKETYTSVKEKEYLGEFEVFDITVNNVSHTYWSGGLSVSNCGEQSLNNFETCCLAEIFLPNIETKEELKKVARLLYKINKHSLALPCHSEETEEIVHKNMRMGIGITGYLMATNEQQSWLSDIYEDLREFDIKYSAKHNWPVSIKLTTVKPSGTLSLLAGTTSGIHPGFARYFIRRIRMSSSSPLVNLCRANGYPVEYQVGFDGAQDRNTVVVSFPCSYPENTILAKDMTAVDQLEIVKKLQSEWSDNAVSCTVYYKKEELPQIKEWLQANYNKYVKSISFLLHKDHGFTQAPFEEISEQSFNAFVKKVRPISNFSFAETDLLDSLECATGACPTK